MTRPDVEYLIDNYILGRNAERNRKMAKRYLIDGITLERLAEEFELSTTQTQRITSKVTKQIAQYVRW